MKEYTTEVLEGYGKAYAVLKRAFDRKHIRVTPFEYDKCQDTPAIGFTQLYLKAIQKNILNSTDDFLISYYMSEIPSDFEVTATRATPEEQGVWVLAAWGKRIHTLTPAQVAEQLDVSAPMVTKLIQQGKIDAVKVDGHWLISQHSVTMYNENRRNQ